MKKITYDMILLILYVVLVIVIFQGYTKSHETAHQKISEYHGCNDVKIVTSLDFSGYSKCQDKDYIESDQESYLHSLNEIVGYHLQWLLATLVSIGYIFIMKKLYEEK